MDEIIQKLAAHSKAWIAPPSQTAKLEYEFISRPLVIPIKAIRGESQPENVWMGATLHTGFHTLLESPSRFDLDIQRDPKAQTITLHAKLKEDKTSVRIEVGNGVKTSWLGYFSHPTRRVTLVVDAERFVPLEEQTDSSKVFYSDWQATGSGGWVPRRVDVLSDSTHYRMHFRWLDDAVWLLQFSESISPEEKSVLTRTRNVQIDGRAVTGPATDPEDQDRSALAEVFTMLDHNRPWLDDGPNGTGWRPPAETLSYSFHTVREDVREACTLDRDGNVLIELTHDGLGKLKGQLGDRRVALKTQEGFTSKRGSQFAHRIPPPDRSFEQPYPIALKRYARMGCQLELPLFQYRDRLKFAAVSIEEGHWAGRPCRVVTVSNLGPGIHFGCGTMLAFSSWSYIHHIVPRKELIYIDSARHIPIHQTLLSARDERTFEIDFDDHVEVEPGQWAPRSIRIESKDQFTCEYRFQLVAGTHWLLDEVVSWFKPEEKSRGVVADVRLEGGRERLDEGLRQVETARDLFKGQGEPNPRADLNVIPLPLGRTSRSGPYEIGVTIADSQSIIVTATTNDPASSNLVPLCFLDEKQRLLFAASVTLERRNGSRQGSVSFRSTQAWRSVRSMAVPAGDPASARLQVPVVPVRWGESMAVNIPDAREGEIPDYGLQTPRTALTRAWRARLDRADDGSANLTLDLVSVDGPRQFLLDVAVAMLSESGDVVSCGHLSTNLEVKSPPVEPRFEIKLGPFQGRSEPKFIMIGLAPGDLIAAPMGARWLAFGRSGAPFDIGALLAAEDAHCRRVGLAELNKQLLNRTLTEEFLGNRVDGRWIGDGLYSRRTRLAPHVESLVRIVENSAAPDVTTQSARSLAYSEAKQAVNSLATRTADPDQTVRDAVSIGLVFLGQTEPIGQLRSILKRTPPLRDPKGRADRLKLEAFRSVERDTLIALAHQGSDAAVDLLGETLLAALEAINPEAEPQSFRERESRVHQSYTLLGRVENPRAIRWLMSILDLMDRQPKLAKQIDQHILAKAMLRFKERTKDRIATELETGPSPEAWASVLRSADDPDFVISVRAMLRRKDVDPEIVASGVDYLCEADDLDGLRELYDRGAFRDEPRSWLALCKAVARCGDERAMVDLTDALVDLERLVTQAPPGEKSQEVRRRGRETQRKEIEKAFSRFPTGQLRTFLGRKTDLNSPEERRVVLRLLWNLPEVPEPLTTVIPRWVKDADVSVATEASRLLARD